MPCILTSLQALCDFRRLSSTLARSNSVVFKYNNGIYLCARPRQLSLQGCQVTITNFTKGGKKIFNTAVAETT